MQITKRFTFSAGHRLSTHTGLCANLHGHNFTLEVTVEGEIDIHTGMVIDFSTMKKIVKEYLDIYDHALILNSIDTTDIKIGRVIRLPFEPTVENMAEKFLMDLRGYDLNVIKIRLYETEDSYAEVLH